MANPSKKSVKLEALRTLILQVTWIGKSLISGYMFMLDNYLISWKATLQHIVALLSTEAEFVAIAEAVKESMWLRGLLNEFWLKQKIIQIFCDN